MNRVVENETNEENIVQKEEKIQENNKLKIKQKKIETKKRLNYEKMLNNFESKYNNCSINILYNMLEDITIKKSETLENIHKSRQIFEKLKQNNLPKNYFKFLALYTAGSIFCGAFLQFNPKDNVIIMSGIIWTLTALWASYGIENKFHLIEKNYRKINIKILEELFKKQELNEKILNDTIKNKLNINEICQEAI